MYTQVGRLLQARGKEVEAKRAFELAAQGTKTKWQQKHGAGKSKGLRCEITHVSMIESANCLSMRDREWVQLEYKVQLAQGRGSSNSVGAMAAAVA
jgi:hypothetical protein